MSIDQAQFDSAFSAFEQAVSIAGSQTQLAKIVGCTPANIGQLLGKRKLLSPKFVLAAEAATGVSRHDLRPDIYPREDPPAQPPASPVQQNAGGSLCGASAADRAGAEVQQ